MNRLVWSFGFTGNVCHQGRFGEVGAVNGGKLGQEGVDVLEEE